MYNIYECVHNTLIGITNMSHLFSIHFLNHFIIKHNYYDDSFNIILLIEQHIFIIKLYIYIYTWSNIVFLLSAIFIKFK